MFTYSFLDTNAALVGPGGAIPLGAGAGVAEEGIDVTQNAEMDTQTIGADGEGMHSLVADRSGKVVVRLLKTSPTNSLLSNLAQIQRTSSTLHGQNTLTISNVASGDVITCEQVAFSKIPDLKYAKEGGIVEWEFNAIKITPALGSGTA